MLVRCPRWNHTILTFSLTDKIPWMNSVSDIWILLPVLVKPSYCLYKFVLFILFAVNTSQTALLSLLADIFIQYIVIAQAGRIIPVARSLEWTVPSHLSSSNSALCQAPCKSPCTAASSRPVPAYFQHSGCWWAACVGPGTAAKKSGPGP